MRKVMFVFLASLLVIGVTACGTPAPAETKELTLGQGDEITFRAVGGQQGPVEVKIVCSTIIGKDVYFQAFADGELMDGGQIVYEDLNLFTGLTLQPEDPPQLTIEYNPDLWEVVP